MSKWKLLGVLQDQLEQLEIQINSFGPNNTPHHLINERLDYLEKIEVCQAELAGMPIAETLECIRQRRNDNLPFLDLSGQRLTHLPPQIGRLKRITKLNIANNRLQSLPPEIGLLENVEIMHISNNQLESLPDEIGYLGRLRELEITRNLIKRLPTTIRNLRNLRRLDCDYDRIEYPPKSILKQGADAIRDFFIEEKGKGHWMIPGITTKRDEFKRDELTDYIKNRVISGDRVWNLIDEQPLILGESGTFKNFSVIAIKPDLLPKLPKNVAQPNDMLLFFGSWYQSNPSDDPAP